MTTLAPKLISVKLDSAVHSRIKRLAESRSRTPHWVMREAIETYVEREEKREALRQATLTAWQNYEETGLHLTGDEADGWLAALADGQDIEPPTCHV